MGAGRVTNGSPTPSSHAPNQRATDRQADRILAMLTGGTPLETVITAGIREGWTRARVLAVIRDHGIPLDAAGRLTGTTAQIPTNPGQLLDHATGLDDPRIARLTAHIRADLGTLRALCSAVRDRREAAARMVAADLRHERLYAQHLDTHRRTADNQQEDAP